VTLPPIIGLNGVARAGKDTVAKILHDLYGYEIASFSDILNRALIALNPIVDVVPQQGDTKDGVGWYGATVRRYAVIEEELGYEATKENPEVRRLLQAMGTEVGRNLLGPDIWVDALFNNLPKGQLVAITNVRFPNEAEAVWARGGKVWEVTRPGFKPALGHVSDTALDALRKDAYIHNDSSIPALADKVIDLLSGEPWSPLGWMHNEGVRASG
jgi:hypothetical protein